MLSTLTSVNEAHLINDDRECDIGSKKGGTAKKGLRFGFKSKDNQLVMPF
jgi:hypothetical protein